MFELYFKNLYQRTMREAYGVAEKEIISALTNGGKCLDCGANTGDYFSKLENKIALTKEQYHGIEWNQKSVNKAQEKGFNVVQGDLNKLLPYDDNTFSCVFGLSLLEHLLNGCQFMRESHRVLNKGGKLVLLTPNISTLFTIALLVVGKMPSSGPHPDSEALIKTEELFKVSSDGIESDAESDYPVHRHLIVFSYRVLKKYLTMLGFKIVEGYGFGLYPLPNFIQPLAEKIDPYHCHQMVFIAQK